MIKMSNLYNKSFRARYMPEVISRYPNFSLEKLEEDECLRIFAV